MSRRSAAVLFVALVILALPVAVTAVPGAGGPPVPAPAGEAAGVCDPLDPANCLLPFPSDHFTVADATTATGRRTNFSPLALPTNVAGKPWDPTEWNRNDGYSPGTPILARVPNLDLEGTWGMDQPQLTDLNLSLRSTSPIVLLDATTGERHPFWSELDTHPDTTDDERLLIIRPAKNLAHGHRYIVALRDLRDTDGRPIPAQAPFAALRDGAPAPVTSPGLEGRRAATERVLADLAARGVARDARLYLAWDFTVASARNLTERVLTMRDHAFALLGDTNLADGVVAGTAPKVDVTGVVDRTPAESRGTARTITGTITVPNFLTYEAQTSAALPDAAGDAVESIADALDTPDPLGEGVDLLTDESLPVAAPGSRLFYGIDGKPAVNPAMPSMEVGFECHLPHAHNVPHADGLADGLVYGHGLLGGHGEAAGSSTEDLRLRGFAPCAIDWLGMATADLANVASMLADMSNFPSLADRAQQGFVNFLYLARAMAHPGGFAAQPAFQDAAGTPRLRTGSVAYDGNSQGGIMGGAVTALAVDWTKAKLGVPAMNYSTLLNRSVDWEGAYGDVAYAFYPSKLDQQLVFGLIQMVWDRGEGNGYAHHMTSNPLPNTPPHQVMLQVAYSDHQVANVAAEVEARTIGARMHWPAFGADWPHWSVDPKFGMARASYGGSKRGKGQSVIVYWYSADRGNTMPPLGNVPPRTGGDPHSDPRKDNAASDQVAYFLRTGQLIDVCGGAPCVTTDATRSNG